MSDAQRSEAERFDAYYAESRDRLLALAFALTGDLSASRGAVRETFVAAWHHWRRVGRLEDPDTWLRPQVWSRAQRRHTARIWHRDRRLDPEVKATLDALAKLSAGPRKALLLTQLSSASRQDMAREVGLPLEAAEMGLQTATSQFALQRGVPSTSVRPMLDQLAAYCRDRRWPRATIVRRSGTARRRTHALAGAAIVVVALVGSGFLVTDTHGVHPSLAAAGDRLDSVPTGGTGEGPRADPQISPSFLVSSAQVGQAMPGRSWRITGTDPKQGMTFPCQRSEYADPRATTALVRNFVSRRQPGQPRLTVVQGMEVSADATAAATGYDTARGWFAACAVPRMQLLGVRAVHRLGDAAEQYVLRGWQSPATTYVLGVARTGRIDTVTVTRTPGTASPDLGGNLRILTAAVDDLCATPLGGSCSAIPKPVRIPVPRAGLRPALLSEFDLPPVGGVTQPWVGSTPERATKNVAATGCDQSSFTGPDWKHALTRSFLIPGGPLTTSFGLTETAGRLPPARAAAFLQGVRGKLASCPSRELGTKVARLGGGATWSAWRVRTEVTKGQILTFYMGVVRDGGAVAQVGFVPDGAHTMSSTDFVALLHRAGERLSAMRR